MFGPSKPAGVQDVSNVGDKAYWNPSFGQLNVLKNGNWYILSNGTLDKSKSTQADALKLYEAVKDNL